MPRLKDFRVYLDGRRERLTDIEQSLVALQEHYESFFGEICRVRESELGQLTEHFTTRRKDLGDALNAEVDRISAEVTAELDEEVARLEGEVKKLTDEAEANRDESLQAEKVIRQQNVELDSSEEQLKERAATLRERIDAYNARIRQLSTGFGFFANFFRMRGLMKERRLIEQEQADVMSHIEVLRERWAAAAKEHTEHEDGLRAKWVDLRTEAAALETKVDYLRSSRERLVTRTTMERILFRVVTEPALGGEGDPACPRCGKPNPEKNHFCAYCAQRLGEDRPDLRGSWEEIAEINHHHAVFSRGMQACQEIIGLIRGLRSGVDAFTESVDDMIATEDRYPLPKLQISVPAASVEYGRHFDNLAAHLESAESRHPVVFAAGVKELTDEVFTEDRIKDYFETMGQELSRQADAQW